MPPSRVWPAFTTDASWPGEKNLVFTSWPPPLPPPVDPCRVWPGEAALPSSEEDLSFCAAAAATSTTTTSRAFLSFICGKTPTVRTNIHPRPRHFPLYVCPSFISLPAAWPGFLPLSPSVPLTPLACLPNYSSDGYYSPSRASWLHTDPHCREVQPGPRAPGRHARGSAQSRWRGTHLNNRHWLTGLFRQTATTPFVAATTPALTRPPGAAWTPRA